MKTLKIVAATLVLSSTMAFTTGCSTAQKGAASGGLLGGIAGAVVGNNWAPTGPATGAVVGGSSGAAVGGLAGDAYDQITAEDVDRELENLRAQLMEKEKQLADLMENGANDSEALAELEATKQRVAELESQLAKAEAAAAEAQMAQQELDAKQSELARLREELEAAESEASTTEEELARLRNELAQKENALNELSGKVEFLQTSLSGKESKLSELSEQLKEMDVKLESTSEGLTLTILDSLLYNPGEAQLTDDGIDLIDQIAEILNNEFPNREFRVEGHTDNQPIGHSGWHSNWELGAARALTLVHELTEVHGIAPDRVSAASHGEHDPIASNETAEGRRQNRRAVIVVLPEKVKVERRNLAQAN